MQLIALLLKAQGDGFLEIDPQERTVERCHNTTRLNLDSRVGIWGLTLVRLHQQASKPYLEIATSLHLGHPEGLANSCPGSPRLTTAYKTDRRASRKIRMVKYIRLRLPFLPESNWAIDIDRSNGHRLELTSFHRGSLKFNSFLLSLIEAELGALLQDVVEFKRSILVQFCCFCAVESFW